MKITAILKAKRCEVCHQADQFNAVLEHCSRCNELTAEKQAELTSIIEMKQWLAKIRDKTGVVILGLLLIGIEISLVLYMDRNYKPAVIGKPLGILFILFWIVSFMGTVLFIIARLQNDQIDEEIKNFIRLVIKAIRYKEKK